ncbi:MAG: T9SS type A sorting domain-containing protein, partial [Bacteroidota bacterium]
TAGSNSPVCTGNPINLTANTVAGATYSWTGPNGFTSSAEDPTIASSTTAMAGTYTVTITVGSCSSTNSTNVTVNTSPTATAGSNSPVCAGTTLNLTANTVAGATYAWTGPGGYTSSLEDPSRPSSTTAMSGNYTVTITAGGCSASSTAAVTINTAPAATAGSNSPVCEGGAINLTTNTVAGATYSWTGPNGFTSSAEDPTIASSTAVMSGTYTVVVAVGTCTASSSVSVTVNPSPVANATSNSPVCSGTGNSITLFTPTVAGATYSWTGPGGYTSTLQNPVRVNPNATWAGNYTVTVTAGGCSSSSTVNVVVNITPNPTIGSNSPVCEGATLNLTSTTITGTPVYSWTGPNGFTSSLEDPSVSNTTLSAAGTYTLVVTNNGCTSTADNITVTINPSPVATASNTGPYCVGQTISLNAGTVSGATYAWSGPGAYTSALEDPTRPSSTTAMTGTYQVIVIAGGCSDTATTSVIVSASPSASASSNSPVCEGQTIALDGGNIAGASYSWTGPNGFTSSLEDPSLNNASTLEAGTYSLTVTIGSCSNTASTSVSVNPAPVADAGPDQTICAGDYATMSASGGGTYLWTPNTNLDSDTAATVNANPSSSITYVVTVSLGGCTDTDSVNVTVNTLPANPTISQSGDTLSANPSSGFTYQWYLNGNPIAGANSSTYVMTQNGDYMVEITDGNGCSSNSATQSVTNVTVPDPEGIISLEILPNPNNGNFVIALQTTQSDNYSVNIHNNIGQLVYVKEITVGNGKTDVHISFPSFARGVYTLTLYNENGKAVKRLIVH